MSGWHWFMLYMLPGLFALLLLALLGHMIPPEQTKVIRSFPMWFRMLFIMSMLVLWPIFFFGSYIGSRGQQRRRT